VKTGYLIHAGDEVSVCAHEPERAAPFPEEIPLDVLYEDPDLAVINKPAGMVCHIGAGIRSGTLVNALLHRYGPLEAEDAVRPGIVHRLDKLTSGLLVIARNKWTHRGLAQQFKSREVKKEYLALVHGRPRPPSGTIELPLGRDPHDRKKISIHARRKRMAITHFCLERALGSVSLLRIRIETGRTHQIRVHLAQKGYPIVGDALYGGNRDLNLPKLAAGAGLGRIFLHAHHLEFRHPRTGKALSFTAPLPPELSAFLALLE
jgi:23S rRNA pseudouridine1911/1915/1917 synthase